MIELMFLKVLILKNVKKHLEKVIYVNFTILLDKNFNYGPYLCNGCNNMSLKAVNHYRVNFAFMSKNDASNLIKNATIIDKNGTL